MVISAVGIRFHSFGVLYARRWVSSCCLVIPFERPARRSGAVVDVSVCGIVAMGGRIIVVRPTPIVRVAVIERSALRVITVVILNYVMVMPVVAPMMPTPRITSVKANSETDSER